MNSRTEPHLISYLWIICLMSLPAGMMIGLQIGTLSKQYKRIQESFSADVKKAIQTAQYQYALWNSHTSSENNKNSYNSIYTNADSSFVMMIAQSAQAYPLLDFQPDTLLPKIRNEQFQRFKDEMERTRRKENTRLKEFYIFRSVQYCMDCEQKKLSIAQIFPMDSLIRTHLKAEKIDAEVQIAFFDKKLKKYIYTSKNADTQDFNASEHRFDFTEKEQLRLYFPHYGQYLFASLLTPIIASLILVVISLLCYFFAYKLLMRQKKLSQLKNDFINNVTHEFKTPIATIAFAVANIENEKVLQNPTMIAQFTKVIKDENKRLNAQVEKVLQAAICDEKALELKKENVNLHQLINELADAYELKIKEKGKIHRKLNAGQAQISGDAFHLSNAISNLLDNAVKYSEENIEIIISTESNEKGIVIKIADKGIGISKENQKLVFDKFYRISTGNLHNVKGFGLGLSYVKDMVERHKGTISLQSKINQGSTFTIFMPFQTDFPA